MVEGRVRRRDFIRVVFGSAATWPLAAGAQQPATHVIGFLHGGAAKPFEGVVGAFRQGLSETGYNDQQNVAIEFRWAEGHYDRLPELATELVRRQVALIVTGGGEGTA